MTRAYMRGWIRLLNPTMASRYKFRCEVAGHEKDVRSVANALFPEGAIISGSRDVTARVWTPNEYDLGFREAHVMSGHSNFVSCVCVMPPDDTYPQGLIMTGSHDNTILAFTLTSPQPVFKLEGHADTVCALSAGKFGTLLSGSWDTTAKVWIKQRCMMTLQAHEAAVWAVAIMPEGGFMLTGSADKTIKMWKAGKCERTFRGHMDCVRGLAVLTTAEFLSCANDTSVRRWLVSGECSHVYHGHTSYVYSIAILPNGEDFVTGGEDRTLRVWQQGECQQTLTHPTESVWTVCVLPNGDIITGASDGLIRVFSSQVERQADEQQQKAYEEQLAAATIPAQIGDIKTEDLIGPDALLNPGKRDGQTVMVKDGNRIEAHQWSASEGRWIKVGDVVGGSGGSEASSGKKLYQGKEYDFVFDVELQEGQPPLQLPFNIAEDPWMAAHNFLERNEISQMFVDQVANFILDQTKGITLGQAAPALTDPFTGESRYVPGSEGASGVPAPAADPFTGAGRYIPSAESHQQQLSHHQPAHGADPFTGGGSYRPAGAASPASARNGPDTRSNPYYPLQIYHAFDQANIPAIMGKLQTFNSRADEGQKVDEALLGQCESLMAGKEPTAPQLQMLWTILQWPAGVVFPALDVLRMAICTEAVNQRFCNLKDGPDFLSFLLTAVSADSPPANQMLALRTLCNAFRHSSGEVLLLAHRDEVLPALLAYAGSTNRNVQIAVCTLLLDYAVAYGKSPDAEAKVQCLSAVAEIYKTQSDPEALFRLLVCLGTLTANDRNCVELAKSMDLRVLVDKCQGIHEPQKVAECARLLSDVLK